MCGVGDVGGYTFLLLLAGFIRLLFASWQSVREVGWLQVILGLCTFLLLPVRMRRCIRGSFHFCFLLLRVRFLLCWGGEIVMVYLSSSLYVKGR